MSTPTISDLNNEIVTLKTHVTNLYKVRSTPVRGYTGEKGEQGPQGLQGPAGAQGPTGPQGERGFTGEKGAQGDRGEQGIQGNQGPQGDRGYIGETGPQGPRGERGETGATGATGERGFTGPQGPQGVQGLKGDKGETGATGPQGPEGAASLVPGIDGLSAYQIALEEGFSGTRQEWLNSLTGSIEQEHIDQIVKIPTLETDVSNLKTKTDTHDADISALNTKASSNESQVVLLNSTTAANQSAITSINSTLSNFPDLSAIKPGASDFTTLPNDMSGVHSIHYAFHFNKYDSPSGGSYLLRAWLGQTRDSLPLKLVSAFGEGQSYAYLENTVRDPANSGVPFKISYIDHNQSVNEGTYCFDWFFTSDSTCEAHVYVKSDKRFFYRKYTGSFNKNDIAGYTMSFLDDGMRFQRSSINGYSPRFLALSEINNKLDAALTHDNGTKNYTS